MAELLVAAQNHELPDDPDKDRRGCYKRGYVIVIMPDGHPWGTKECLPWSVVIKLPGVSVHNAILQKYVGRQFVGATGEAYRRRRWQLRWADLPTAAKTRLQNDGELVIKVGTYSGSYDYTWTQVKGYFRDLQTGLDETETF